MLSRAPTSMKKPESIRVPNRTNRNIWLACSRVPDMAEMRIPVVEPVRELKLMMITNEMKLVFRLRSNASTQRVISSRD